MEEGEGSILESFACADLVELVDSLILRPVQYYRPSAGTVAAGLIINHFSIVALPVLDLVHGLVRRSEDLHVTSMGSSLFVMQMVVMVVHRSLLAIFAASFMSPQIVQSRKPSLTAQMMPLADEMLVLRLVTRHVSSEVGAFGVEELIADMAVSLVLPGMRGEVRHQDLLVHERLGASGESAFERAALIVGVGSGEMLLGDVTGERCRGAEAGRAIAPGAR